MFIFPLLEMSLCVMAQMVEVALRASNNLLSSWKMQRHISTGQGKSLDPELPPF